MNGITVAVTLRVISETTEGYVSVRGPAVIVQPPQELAFANVRSDLR